MADDLEKEVLKIQRDAAFDEADTTAAERDVIAGQRDAAFTRASVEQDSATKSATAFYVLLAVAVLAAIVIAAVYFNRPDPQPATTVYQPVGPAQTNGAPVILNRQAPVAPAASAPTSAMPAPQVMTRPAPPPPPVVVNTPPAQQTVIVNPPPAPPAPANAAPASPAPMPEGTANPATPAAPLAGNGANAGGSNAGGANAGGANAGETAPVTSTAPAAPTTSAAPPSGQ